MCVNITVWLAHANPNDCQNKMFTHILYKSYMEVNMNMLYTVVVSGLMITVISSVKNWARRALKNK